MKWVVELHEEYVEEFKLLPSEIQDNIAIKANLLKEFGTQPKRYFTSGR